MFDIFLIIYFCFVLFLGFLSIDPFLEFSWIKRKVQTLYLSSLILFLIVLLYYDLKYFLF